MKTYFKELNEKINFIKKKNRLIKKKTAFIISNTAKFKNVPFFYYTYS